MEPTLVSLEDRRTRLLVAPQIGGSLVDWTTRAEGIALLRRSDNQALAANASRYLACYPLVPWSNRISSGGFQGPDDWFALTANSPTDPLPIHGSAWQQPWFVVDRADASLRLRLDSAQPFAYRAEQHFTLEDGQLTLQLTVTHLDARAAWHGLGWHPHFPRTPRTRLQMAARRVWLSDAARLPTHCADIPPAWDFRHAQGLPDTLLDNAFVGWDGQCRIIQPDLGHELLCQATTTETCLVYCPVGQPYFCFEPVSHPVDAHHLPGRPGLRLLHQGQSTGMTFSLRYRPLD